LPLTTASSPKPPRFRVFRIHHEEGADGFAVDLVLVVERCDLLAEATAIGAAV
jgi:hypothetical protein